MSSTPIRSSSRRTSRTPATATRSAATPDPSVHSTLTLFVKGLASDHVMGDGCTSAFKSTTPVSHSYVADEMRKVTPHAFSPQPHLMTPRKSPSESRRGSAAFASRIDDRYSYIPRSSTPTSSFRPFSADTPVSGRRAPVPEGRGTPSAVFRSTTPKACAHINAVPSPLDVAYDVPSSLRLGNTPGRSPMPSSSFMSSPGRDSYIKAQPRRSERFLSTFSAFNAVEPGMQRSSDSLKGTAVFRSRASIGDAHIKALPKPVDVCLAFSPVSEQ